LFVAVVTGGRPMVKQRPVANLLPALEAAGVHSIAWVVSDADAPGYEADRYPMAVYPREWAVEYAGDHWMLPGRPGPDDFLGAFPGREWACREAERRGCWGVLQLDDNINGLGFVRYSGFSKRFVQDQNGGLGLFADVLSAVTLSTNARTCGAQVGSVDPDSSLRKVARAGFPYSLFVEQVGPGREEWFGPFEDDITHSFQYGGRHDGVTAGVVPILQYSKETTSKTGMRKKYNHTRSVQLQRIFPEGARISLRKTHSNGQGNARVFHTMPPGAIRNKLRVTDPALFGQVKRRIERLAADYFAGDALAKRDKVLERAGKGTT